MRLALARREHRHRRLVGVQHLALQQLRLHRLDQRLQSGAALTDPGPRRRARDRQSGAAEDRFLAVQRQVIGMLGHEHLREQSRRRDALVDDRCRHRSLYQRAATGTGPLAAHVALHREHAWRVVELLADVFANALHAAATSAGGVLGLVVALDARQLGRQGAARLGVFFSPSPVLGGSVACSAASCSSMAAMSPSTASSNSARCIGVELLALGAVLQPFELRNLEGELVDLGVTPADLVRVATAALEQLAGQITQLDRRRAGRACRGRSARCRACAPVSSALSMLAIGISSNCSTCR